MGSDPNAVYTSEKSPAETITELCALLYTQGYVTGTAGGMSIRENGKIWVSPSGVQKERMEPNQMFILDSETGDYLEKPENFKPSACTPLFIASYQARDCGACIHTHSATAVLITKLWDQEFRISNIENIKAIPRVTRPGNLDNTDTLVIPIIDNAPHEEGLEPQFRHAMLDYPQTSAILVRNHGIFVWGRDIWKAKVLHEAIDYLMDLALRMKQLGLEVD